MGFKRSKDGHLAVTRKKARKLKKKAYEKITQAENSYEALTVEPDHDIHHDVVLIDSSNKEESDNVLVVSDDEKTKNVTISENNLSGDIEFALDSDRDQGEDQQDDPNGNENENENENGNGNENENENGNENENKNENEVSTNKDFIGFGFSSSDEEETPGDYSDDGVVSDDNTGVTHSHRENSVPFPWVKGHDHSRQKEIADWLTLEIKDFVNYISPSKEEIHARNCLISNLKESINRFWPATQAHVFGSCATDLYLPGSDVDMVIVSTTGDYEQRSRLYQLSSYLRTNKLAKNIEVIASAKVPIIKFVDPKYNIHVDISFERTNGLDAARRIRKWLDATPGLRELVLIVKQFLRSRKLNNVHVGGLGGYATIIMVYHFLKLHPRLSTGNVSALENLGTLLIEFFELYGRNFSYDNLIISLNPNNDMPRYLQKHRNPVLSAGKGLFALVIQDPSDPANNITRSSYNVRDLKKAFGGAYQLLVAKCYELNSASYKGRIGQLILGDIIKFRGADRDFNDDRDKVVNSALISHESDDESDGADGNDKYYFSDMTEDEDDYVLVPERAAKTENEAKKAPKALKKTPKKTPKKDVKDIKKESMDTVVSRKRTADSTDQPQKKRKVEDFLSIEQSEESEEEKKPKSNLNKDVRKEYWKLKGLEVPGNKV